MNNHATKENTKALIALLLFLAASTWLHNADASEVQWFPEGPTLFIGLQTSHHTPVCYGRRDWDQTAYMGANQPLMQYKAVTLSAAWTHFSCVYTYDAARYDGIGLTLSWRLF